MTTKSSIKNGIPLLIGGMHRAGTSLLANLLRQAGLHTGCDLDPNGESLFFISRNEWLLEQAGCRWDNPAHWHEWIAPLQDKAAEQLSITLQRYPARRAFWGKRICPPPFIEQKQPWGWKDPRNTYTFPIWKKIFPQARMLMITRHGVDVAKSLMVRAESETQRWRATKTPPPHRLITGSPRCLSIENAFTLWEQYQSAIQTVRQNHPNETLLIQYETLVKEPAHCLAQVHAFCDLHPVNQQIHKQIQSTRTQAYRKDPELTAFAQAHAERLQTFGYEP